MNVDDEISQIVTDKANKIREYDGEKSKLKEKYENILKKGADSSSIHTRRVFAFKAKIIRLKLEILELEQLKLIKDMSEMLEELGQSEIQSFVEDPEIHSKITEASSTTPADYQSQIDELKQTIQAELHDMESTHTELKESVESMRRLQRNADNMGDMGSEERKLEELSRQKEHAEIIIALLDNIAKAEGNIEDFDEIKFEFIEGGEEPPKD